MLKLKKITVYFADGSYSECEVGDIKNIDKAIVYRFRCKDVDVVVEDRNGVVFASIRSMFKLLSAYEFMSIDIDFNEINDTASALVLTLNTAVAEALSKGFNYYNYIAVDREPRGEKPSDFLFYPSRLELDLNYVEHLSRVPCWTYPVFINSLSNIPKYSVFTLIEMKQNYLAMKTLSDKTTSYIGPNLKISIFSGRSTYEIESSYIMVYAVNSNPYKAIEECVQKASNVVSFRVRKLKKIPSFIHKLGWCSWNALLTEDLSHQNILNIVKKLKEKGVPIKWVIIDDGWQISSPPKSYLWFSKVIEKADVDKSKFPHGFQQLVKELKNLDIELVGLWITINMYWGGAGKQFVDYFGVDCFRFSPFESCIPPPDLKNSYYLYSRLFSWIKECGFDFLKVDNQWIIHLLYQGVKYVGEASKEIEYGMQIAAEAHGLDILNCMAMTPENYNNFVISNVMRTSIDYIPFWKPATKLHVMFNAYNSILFNNIAYPDYDMWITYDPYSKIHAVARVMSGGPVYITDRNYEKTDVELIKKITLPNGEIVKVDEPGLPTRDILFKDPYNERILLKIASTCRNFPVVAVFNIHKNGCKIVDKISLKHLPFNIEPGFYAYYSVFSRNHGIIDFDSGEIEIELNELEVDIYVFSKLVKNKALIGLKEFILPSYPLEIYRIENDKIIAKFKIKGTTLALIDKKLTEFDLKNEFIEISI